jgi:hypothetical protein
MVPSAGSGIPQGLKPTFFISSIRHDLSRALLQSSRVLPLSGAFPLPEEPTKTLLIENICRILLQSITDCDIPIAYCNGDAARTALSMQKEPGNSGTGNVELSTIHDSRFTIHDLRSL